MKVTVTCEECGRELLIYHPADLNRPTFDSPTECDMRTVITQLTCPNCAKLTYGPLTEEMMAEAIVAVADKWALSHDMSGPTVALQKSLSVDEARFVLRLIKDITPDELRLWWSQTDEELRDWLLDLARQK